MSIVQEKAMHETASQWIAGLDAALTSALPIGESNALIREVFAAFLLLRWTDLQDAEQEAMAVFEGRSHQPLLPAPLQWRHWSQLEKPNEIARWLGEVANRVEGMRGDAAQPLAAYLHTLADPLRRVLKVNFSYLRDLVRWVDKLPFETVGERRELLEVFDRVLAETQEAREEWFASPPAIARLVALLANPRPGERVYDPCFGTGRFLIEAWHQAQGSRSDTRLAGPLLEVAGVEVNASPFLVGLIRMLLAGIDTPHLELGDALERDAVSSPTREGFDVVLADPPWGKLGNRNSREPWLYQQYPFPSTDAVGLFVQHALAQLKPHGRAVIAVPEGFLFRGGAERELRRSLVERGQVQAVVALPAGAFAPKTQLKSCVIILSKQGGASRVRMADASSLFTIKSGGKGSSLSSELARQFVGELFRGELRAVRSLPVSVAPDTPQTGQLSRSIWEVSAEALKSLEWDLTPRRREEGGLADLLEGIQDAFEGKAMVFPITEVCDVIAGRAIKARNLEEAPVGDRPIGYLRIKDLGPGKSMRPSSWLSETILESERSWALLPGDVLLSRSGTIGKATLVRNGAIGAVAANGLFVLRTNRNWLDPGFLVAYLASPAVQSWLAARARGSAIQHVNRSVINELPVINPPLDVQARAVGQYRDSGTDVLEFLLQASGAFDSERLTVWLAELDSKVPTFNHGLDATPSLELIEPLVGMAAIAKRWVEAEQVTGQSLRWLEPLIAALLPLSGLAQIPSGASLLTILQDAAGALEKAMQESSGHLPTESQARGIAERLRDWMRAAISDLFDNWRLSAHAPFARLIAGSFAEFTVLLCNDGMLPLRSVRVESEPDWGIAQSPFLAEEGTLSMALRGGVPKLAESVSIKLRWSGRNLIGHEVGDTIELVLPVAVTDAAAAQMRAVSSDNPYVTGSPLEPRHGHAVFFGREALLAQISRQVAIQGNVILLEGNRRAGKTSILKHLEGRAAIPSWLAVYASLQAAEGSSQTVGVPTAEVFRMIAGEIAKALTGLDIEVPLPNGQKIEARKPALGIAKACREGIGNESPFADFREYLELVLRLLKTVSLKLLLMLDEFDKLQEGIDKGVTSPQVPENIRFLIQTYPEFSAILTGSRRLKRLREEHWSALYGLGTSIQVTALDDESARKMVTVPVSGQLTYSNEAVERVVSLTARQPYLLQCLCNRVFDYAVQTKSQAITLGAVDIVAAALVRDNEHFASLWDYAGLGPVSGRRRRQLILFWCAEGFKRGTQISFSSLREQFTQSGMEVSEEALAADLVYLRELELVDLAGDIAGSHYRLAIPLMADWIEQQQDSVVLSSRARGEVEEEDV